MLELVSGCRQMERDQDDFYQTHMIVGGDAIYVSQDGNSYTGRKMQTNRAACKNVHFQVIIQTKGTYMEGREKQRIWSTALKPRE